MFDYDARPAVASPSLIPELRGGTQFEYNGAIKLHRRFGRLI